MDWQQKSKINGSDVRSTDQNFDQQIKSKLIDKKLKQQIKCLINGSKFASTDQSLPHQIKKID